MERIRSSPSPGTSVFQGHRARRGFWREAGAAWAVVPRLQGLSAAAGSGHRRLCDAAPLSRAESAPAAAHGCSPGLCAQTPGAESDGPSAGQGSLPRAGAGAGGAIATCLWLRPEHPPQGPHCGFQAEPPHPQPPPKVHTPGHQLSAEESCASGPAHQTSLVTEPRQEDLARPAGSPSLL